MKALVRTELVDDDSDGDEGATYDGAEVFATTEKTFLVTTRTAVPVTVSTEGLLTKGTEVLVIQDEYSS